MFGHHPLLQRQLEKDGSHAFATVIDAKRTHWSETWGSDAVVGNTSVLWNFKVRVEPDGEPPFEADLDVLVPQLSSPGPGTRLPVLYDPADHGKVVVDESDAGQQALADEMDHESVDRRVARMRSKGAGAIADRYVKAHELARHMYEDLPLDPDAREQELQDRRDRIGAIMAGGATPAAGMPSGPTILINGQPVRPGGAAASAEATADALTKLAGLRDRGLLTDAEFQAQKKKLLGE